MLFHFHSWTPWEKYKDLGIYQMRFGQEVLVGYQFIQKRTCKKCGLVQYTEHKIFL